MDPLVEKKHNAATLMSRAGTRLEVRVSDHAAGVGMAANGGADDSPVGDRMMAACLVAAGTSSEHAAELARSGGL
jgi:hypothetical protein